MTLPETILIPFFEPNIEIIEAYDDKVVLHRTYIEVFSKNRFKEKDDVVIRQDLRWMILKTCISCIEIGLSPEEDCYTLRLFYGAHSHSTFSFEKKSDALILYSRLQAWLVPVE